MIFRKRYGRKQGPMPLTRRIIRKQSPPVVRRHVSPDHDTLWPRDLRSYILDVDLNAIERSFGDIYRNRPPLRRLREQYESLEQYKCLQSQVVFTEAMEGYRDSLTNGYSKSSSSSEGATPDRKKHTPSKKYPADPEPLYGTVAVSAESRRFHTGGTFVESLMFYTPKNPSSVETTMAPCLENEDSKCEFPEDTWERPEKQVVGLGDVILILDDPECLAGNPKVGVDVPQVTPYPSECDSGDRYRYRSFPY